VKVLIAGGSGLIGRAVCRALLAAGHAPVVLTRDLRRSSRLPAGTRAVAWQPPALGPWVTEVAGAGAIVNLAGASIGRWPWTSRRKAELVGRRVIATRTLVAALGEVPPERRPTVFLSGSGTDLYEGVDAVPADEATPPGDTFLARLCLEWEGEALRAEELGLRVVLMRTSSVIAPGAPFLRVISLPFRLLMGGRLGSGRQWVSWVDVSDVTGLYLWALESGTLRGPLNVAAPDPRRQADFAAALGSVLHRPSRFPTPGWMVRLVLGEQASLPLGSRRIWPAKALASGYVFRHPRLEDSLRTAV
jgi:uncharacterized protein (TIGR01777 family)